MDKIKELLDQMVNKHGEVLAYSDETVQEDILKEMVLEAARLTSAIITEKDRLAELNRPYHGMEV